MSILNGENLINNFYWKIRGLIGKPSFSTPTFEMIFPRKWFAEWQCTEIKTDIGISSISHNLQVPSWSRSNFFRFFLNFSWLRLRHASVLLKLQFTRQIFGCLRQRISLQFSSSLLVKKTMPIPQKSSGLINRLLPFWFS